MVVKCEHTVSRVVAYISEDPSIEELLQLFIAVVDTKLLKTVNLVIFCGRVVCMH